MFLVALGCSRLTNAFDIASARPFVAFGTMEGEKLANLNASYAETAGQGTAIYLYETG